MVAFKPTLAPAIAPSLADAAAASTAKGSKLMARVKSTFKAAVTPSASTPNVARPASTAIGSPQPGERSKDGSSSSKAINDSDSSDSDAEIGEVLDETELELIEAMEDTQISAHKERAGATAAAPADSRLHRLPASPGKPSGWVGLGENMLGSRPGYAETLKQRFSASQAANSSRSAAAGAGGDRTDSNSGSPGSRTVDSREHSASEHNSSADGAAADPHASSIAQSAGRQAVLSHSSEKSAVAGKVLSSTTAQHTRTATSEIADAGAGAESSRQDNPARQSTSSDSSSTTLSASGSTSTSTTVDGSENEPQVEEGGCEPRPASVPLDSVEFVAPGVTKQTAMSLLRRVLDIDGPIIQQKMVEFLLIDGVIASLIGFITHCQGSVYSPSSTSQTAPSSPSLRHEGNGEYSHGHGGVHATASAVPGQKQTQHQQHRSPSELPSEVLEEFEARNQHRARLQRQRNRSAGLTDTDLRRGYNAAHMLSSRDQYARRVVEAKLSVIVPCLMAVFHKDSLGSFHHACLLLEHCFILSPMKTARLLLFQQNPPSRWWSFSSSVAKGCAPICDLLPYLSEPCVQRLFLKAEFGVWTGRLMTSLGLSPNDAVVVSDALNRMGLGSVADALGASSDGGSAGSASGPSSGHQRSKALQLVRNRFVQLNRGKFFNQILELIEDPDPHVSEGVSEFMAFMIGDCSTFLGFNILFKPIYDSEVPVRRLAQLIINSPPQRLPPQAKAATRLLHALLAKTSCQYGLRTREAQGIRDPEMYPRGSQLLLQVGQAARSALESFLPGLFATVVGLQASTDLTSQSAYNRRISVESLRLPEYEEADPDIDTDDTEAETSEADSDDQQDNGYEQDRSVSPSPRIGCTQRLCGDVAASVSDDDSDLRDSAAALLHATYSDSLGSGSISSSLSPSSTLSASPLAIASSTPEHPVDVCAGERLDAEDLGLLVSLPKPDINRLNLLRVCVEVLRETDDIDETVGWVDLRVWRALTTWFLNHPHNNMLHMSVFQLISAIALEAVRLRKVHRRFAADPRAMKVPTDANKSSFSGGYSSNNSGAGKVRCANSGSSGVSAGDSGSRSGPNSDVQQQQSERHTLLAAKRRARRRRAMADRIRREEASNCDNILTYLIEQNQWVDKLVRRATSPNFDGAYGYISLILNTLRLAVQVDRRRSVNLPGKTHARPASAEAGAVPASKSQVSLVNLECVGMGSSGKWEFSDDEASDDAALLPDLAYHDPATRRRLSEYPLYRLQRWEISLLYSPSFRSHLRRLRKQAMRMARKLDEFRLCDQSRTVITDSDIAQRPVPYFSPQRVKPPLSLDNQEIRKKQLQINVGLLLGSNRRPSTQPSSSSSSSSSSSASKLAGGKDKEDGADDDFGGSHRQRVDDVGIDANSLFARMLGFTEDLVELPDDAHQADGDVGIAADNGKAARVADVEEPVEAGDGNDHDGDQLDKSGNGTKKANVGGHNKSEWQGKSSVRRKKSKATSGATSPSSSVSGLFEEMSPSNAADAAEVICTALASDSAGTNTAKHSQSARPRKKPLAATNSVRRRRARLHHRSSSSSLTASPTAAPATPSPAAATPSPVAELESDKLGKSAAAGITAAMQSLDL
ncbi:hypothetical protein GQ54DRAFT_296327, partial [Martensiomyces pterosporus]